MRTTLLLSATMVALLLLGCESPVSPGDGSDQMALGAESAAKGPVWPPEHTQFSAPVDVVTFNICTLEDMHLTGMAHITWHHVEDGRGGVHSHYTANDRGITAVGLTSGRRYRSVGASTFTWNAAPLEEGQVWGEGKGVLVFTGTVRYVGQGPWPDFSVQESYHLIQDAQGRITALRELEWRAMCDGGPLPEEDGAF